MHAAGRQGTHTQSELLHHRPGSLLAADALGMLACLRCTTNMAHKPPSPPPHLAPTAMPAGERHGQAGSAGGSAPGSKNTAEPWRMASLQAACTMSSGSSSKMKPFCTWASGEMGGRAGGRGVQSRAAGKWPAVHAQGSSATPLWHTLPQRKGQSRVGDELDCCSRGASMARGRAGRAMRPSHGACTCTTAESRALRASARPVHVRCSTEAAALVLGTAVAARPPPHPHPQQVPLAASRPVRAQATATCREDGARLA